MSFQDRVGLPLSPGPVLMGKAPELYRRWRAADRYGAEEDQETVMRKLTTVPLLCVDDAGKEEQGPKQKEFWYELIDGRYSGGLPIVLTCNGAPEKLQAVVGLPVLSRLNEMIGENWLDLSGPDYRFIGRTP